MKSAAQPSHMTITGMHGSMDEAMQNLATYQKVRTRIHFAHNCHDHLLRQTLYRIQATRTSASPTKRKFSKAKVQQT